MKSFLQNIFDIRESEGQRTFLMFFYIFFVIASLLIVKPVRNSLFLTHFGVDKLPYAFILVAVSAAIVTWAYSRLAQKAKLDILILNTMLFCIAIFLSFWILLYLQYGKGWFYYAFYVWVALFGVISTSQFWLLANYVFNAREAKRLFGLIGAGAISGGIFGGYLTNFLAPKFGTRNLIFFCIAFLLVCLLLLSRVWKISGRQNYDERIRQQKRVKKAYSGTDVFELFKRSKHLAYLAGIVGLGVIVANLVDFQFNAIASQTITDKDQLTAFFGFWLSNLSIASLLLQLFLTSRILKYLGVSASLFFLPAGILIGAVCILAFPALWSAVLIKVSDGGFKQSINKAGLELLYLPLPHSVNNQGKTIIDVFVDSLATGIGGLLLVLFIARLGLSARYISAIIVVLIAVWIYIINLVNSEYINSFRLALEKRSIDLENQTKNISETSILSTLVNILKGENERQILYVLRLIENENNEAFIPYFPELLHSGSPEIKKQVISLLLNYENVDLSDQVEKLISCENYDVQVAAICYVYRKKHDHRILLDLLKNRDNTIRCAALYCAALEYKGDRDFREQVDMKTLFSDFVDESAKTELDKNEKEFLKITMAQVIGIADTSALFGFLSNLLADDNKNVVESAIRSAGATRHPMFIPHLIHHLGTRGIRNYAREALSEYGEETIVSLEVYLTKASTPRRIRLGIPKVLARIGTQKCVDVLTGYLDIDDSSLQFEILKALNRINEDFDGLKFDFAPILRTIGKKTDNYYRIMALLTSEYSPVVETGANPQPAAKREQADRLLQQALSEYLQDILERIFRLLSLLYPTKDIENAFYAIKGGKDDKAANAIEFLDNILD